MKYEKEMEELIEKAKALVVRNHSPGLPDREWGKAAPPDPYEDEKFRVELYYLGGSPSKGGVVADYGWGIVKAFSPGWVCEHTYRPTRGLP
jgi:hypothetical protein